MADFWYIEPAFPGADEGTLTRWVITAMMIANAIVMIWFGVMIVSGRNWMFFLAILYMALNVVLSITDQFGWIDALILLLNLMCVGDVVRYQASDESDRQSIFRRVVNVMDYQDNLPLSEAVFFILLSLSPETEAWLCHHERCPGA